MSNGMGDDTDDGMGKDMNDTNDGAGDSMDDDTGGIDMHVILACPDGTGSIGMRGCHGQYWHARMTREVLA